MPGDRSPRITLAEAVQREEAEAIRVAAREIASILRREGYPTSAEFAEALGEITAAALPISDRFGRHKGFQPNEAEALSSIVDLVRPAIRRATR